MEQDKFDIYKTLKAKSRAALFNARSRDTRNKFYTVTSKLLRLTRECNAVFNENTATELLRNIENGLTDAQRSSVIDMYLDASDAYQEWCSNKQRKTNSQINYSLSGINGGSGHTGRLKVGFAAPNGSESFHSNDDPRDGLKHLVAKMTASGAGAGYSLGELSGAKQQRTLPYVMLLDDLKTLTKSQLLSALDTATSPANFLRIILTYYGQPMYFFLGNFTVNSTHINNPKNVRSMSELDSIYNYMKKLDAHGLITAERALRFLVLSYDVLIDVKIPKPRRDDKLTKETYEEKARGIRMALSEISAEMKSQGNISGITLSEMRRQIVDDKRKKQWERLNPGAKAHSHNL